MNTSVDHSPWKCALSLSSDRRVTSGSFVELSTAIHRGADLRLYTEFLHEEHIAPGSTTPGINDPRNHGVIRESIDFRETVLVNGRHVTGITVLRQPLEPTVGFNGTQPKMSFFMYNMTGEQSHANILFDASSHNGKVGTRRILPRSPAMPKMSEQEQFDVDTSAPCRNFIYDMEMYRFFVRDEWTMIFAHDADGNVSHGTIEDVEQAQIACREFKVGIRELGNALGGGLDHEVFAPAGSGFFHTRRRFYETLTQPVLRIAPAIPMQFQSRNWDVAWVCLRTDGVATVRRLDPYMRRHEDIPTRLACRWFIR